MSDSLYEEARDIDQAQFDGPVTEDAGCDVAPQEWGHVSTEVLMERVTAGIISDSGDDTTQERADAALTELAERLRHAEDAWQRAEHPFDKAEFDAMAERLKAAERDDGEWAAMGLALTAAEAQRDELVEALEASDRLIRMLRPDLSHTRPRADEIVKRNAAALAKVRG